VTNHTRTAQVIGVVGMWLGGGYR